MDETSEKEYLCTLFDGKMTFLAQNVNCCPR